MGDLKGISFGTLLIVGVHGSQLHENLFQTPNLNTLSDTHSSPPKQANH